MDIGAYGHRGVCHGFWCWCCSCFLNVLGDRTDARRSAPASILYVQKIRGPTLKSADIRAQKGTRSVQPNLHRRSLSIHPETISRTRGPRRRRRNQTAAVASGATACTGPSHGSRLDWGASQFLTKQLLRFWMDISTSRTVAALRYCVAGTFD